MDYFSLDIEGAELPVLKTIPWEKVNIRLLGVEVVDLGKIFDGDFKDLEETLKLQGYTRTVHVGNDAFFWKDPTCTKPSKHQKAPTGANAYWRSCTTPSRSFRTSLDNKNHFGPIWERFARVTGLLVS